MSGFRENSEALLVWYNVSELTISRITIIHNKQA